MADSNLDYVWISNGLTSARSIPPSDRHVEISLDHVHIGRIETETERNWDDIAFRSVSGFNQAPFAAVPYPSDIADCTDARTIAERLGRKQRRNSAGNCADICKPYKQTGSFKGWTDAYDLLLNILHFIAG